MAKTSGICRIRNGECGIDDRQPSVGQKNRLSIVLGVVFVLALLMGAGPGIYLINPDPASSGPAPTWLGMPIVYTWVVFWTFVQGAVVLVAYFSVWNSAESKPHSPQKTAPEEQQRKEES